MKKTIKAIKAILLIIIMIFMVVGADFLGKGYNLYRLATSEIGIDEKINGIKQSADYISLNDISKDFINAIVSVEDHRFYNHNGIDYISVVRASYNNIKAGKIVMGGSTITQQLAKNLFFTNEQSYERKIAELFVVDKLERKYSKDEILELYVNIIYYGDGYYGIKNASLGYFGELPSDININQSILLAGIPQAPEAYSLSKNYDKAVKRGTQVMAAMLRNEIDVELEY